MKKPVKESGFVESEKKADDKNALPSFFNSLILLGISYVFTAIAIGWDLGAIREDFGRNGFGFGFLMAGVGLLFTFTHGFMVGCFGLFIFGQGKEAAAGQLNGQGKTSNTRTEVLSFTQSIPSEITDPTHGVLAKPIPPPMS